jgi:hypothetical protein
VRPKGARTGKESPPEGGTGVKTGKDRVGATVTKAPESKTSLADKKLKKVVAVTEDSITHSIEGAVEGLLET